MLAKTWLVITLVSVFVMTKIMEAFREMTTPFNMLLSALLGFGSAMYYAAGAGTAVIITGGLAATSLFWLTGFAAVILAKLVVIPMFNWVMSFFAKDETVEVEEDSTVKSAQKARERAQERARQRNAETYEAEGGEGCYEVSGV
jgi:predicted membrane protein